MAGHFKKVCRLCGTVIAQCRCPSPEKRIEWVNGCDYCPKDVKK